MGILSWVIVGLIAGAIAKWLHPGPDPGGIFATIVIGIIGAIIGGYVASLLGYGTVDGFDIWSFVIAILGSLVVLFIYRKVRS